MPGDADAPDLWTTLLINKGLDFLFLGLDDMRSGKQIIPSCRLYHPHHTVEELKPSVKWIFSGLGEREGDGERGGRKRAPHQDAGPGLPCYSMPALQEGEVLGIHPSLVFHRLYGLGKVIWLLCISAISTMTRDGEDHYLAEVPMRGKGEGGSVTKS